MLSHLLWICIILLISIFPVMADFLFNQYDDVEIPLNQSVLFGPNFSSVCAVVCFGYKASRWCSGQRYTNITCNGQSLEWPLLCCRGCSFSQITVFKNPFFPLQSQADEEWKFARSKLWMSYFEDSGTLPAPFNIVPSPKSCIYLLLWFKHNLCSCSLNQKRNRWQSIRVSAFVCLLNYSV
jgi:hypothetical protein